MDKYRQKIGKFGEKIAVNFLISKGYKIIDKNIHYRSGEIDILAKLRQKIIFFEVKTRTSQIFGYPEEALDNKKMAKLSQTINNYLINHPEITNWQVDCLSININLKNNKAKIYHLKNLDFSEII